MIEKVRHKYATIGFIYLFGLICAFFIGKIAAFCASLIIAAAAYAGFRRFDRLITLYITVLAAAFLISAVYETVFIDECLELAGKSAYVNGRVIERHNPDNDTVLLTVSGTADGVPLKLTLFAEDTGASVGDTVQFEAYFTELKNDSVFSEASYYYSKGIFIRATAEGPVICEEGRKTPAVLLLSISDWCKKRIDSVVSGDSAGIIKGMLFGDKSDLSARLAVLVKRSGVSHLMAVSGLHLSLMIHLLSVLLRVLFKGNPHKTALFSILFTVVLMIFFRMTASVLRSGIMMILYYSAPFFHRKSSAYNSVGIALMIILAVNPCACMDVGLWLSALGTLGVGTAAPALLKRLKISEERFILSAVVTSFCASVFTAPVGMLCFGGISLTAVVTGLLIQPFFTLTLMLVPLALAVPFALKPLMFTAGLAAGIMKAIISFIGGLHFSYYEPDSEAVAFFGIFLIFTAVISFVISRDKRYIIISAITIVSAGVIALSLYEISMMDKITVKVHSDGTNGLVVTESRVGKYVYVLSDSDKCCDLVYRCVGIDPNFICIASDTDNNKGINADFSCPIHTPDDNDGAYSIGGEYTAVVADGEIILNIDGITVGFMTVKSDTVCDISIYSGYSKNFSGSGNYATILCDKRFYKYGTAVNSYYNDVEIIFNKEGGIALRTK